nr:ComEC/Rec2 family competence protein [uncultured Cellulosilyticum sp.]
MKINKFYKKLSLVGLVLALTFLPGCNSTTAFQEGTGTTAESTTTNKDQSLKDGQIQNATGTKQEVAAKESQIHFIDTGNSDAILIINDGEAMLIDGGDNDDEDFLVKYLNDNGVTELEYLIATHPHADHVGGLDAIVSNLHVNTIFVANGDADTKTYRDFINAAMDKGLTPSVPLEDSQFPLGSAYFKVMNTNGGNDANNQSLVVEYVNGEDKVLLMGDAEKEVEEEILSKLEQVDLLKVGHHGSRTSTSEAFLEKVNPTYAVITCGTGNSYGHPHQETLDKLQGIEIHRTDECGSIIFKSTGHGITTDCENGDLTPGVEEIKDDKSEDDINNENSPTSSSNQASHDVTDEEKQTQSVNDGTADTEIVYWTPKGKSYHKTDKCSALVKSKTILSGTISESGKIDPCDRCYK